MPASKSTQNNMSNPSTRKFGNYILVIVFAVLLLLYFLSMKPALAIANRTPGGMNLFRQFYCPIIWLHDHTPLNKAIESYVNIWGWNEQ
jgi:hypothetical protein